MKFYVSIVLVISGLLASGYIMGEQPLAGAWVAVCITGLSLLLVEVA